MTTTCLHMGIPFWKIIFILVSSCQAAGLIFFDELVINEVDESGTARAAMMTEETDDLEAGFNDEVIKSNYCGFPLFSSADYFKADSTLNRIYSDVMKAKDPIWGTTTKGGIRRTQRPGSDTGMPGWLLANRNVRSRGYYFKNFDNKRKNPPTPGIPAETSSFRPQCLCRIAPCNRIT